MSSRRYSRRRCSNHVRSSALSFCTASFGGWRATIVCNCIRGHFSRPGFKGHQRILASSSGSSLSRHRAVEHSWVDDEARRRFERLELRRSRRESRSHWPLRRIPRGHVGVQVLRRKAEAATSRVVAGGWTWVWPRYALAIVPLVFETPPIPASGVDAAIGTTVVVRCRIESPQLAVTKVASVEVAVLQQLRVVVRTLGDELVSWATEDAIEQAIRSRIGEILKQFGVAIDSVALGHAS